MTLGAGARAGAGAGEEGEPQSAVQETIVVAIRPEQQEAHRRPRGQTSTKEVSTRSSTYK
ncbi:hypothetical protein SKAU_G00123670 [Synaphobranchus kaupii]|uniref:Uncharacterized protein n=1 Tax=Synaphobranchus kaupii TaxID=118154 RepID=A0A9Q1FP08_SYNKA|nr:hypothetical protein SKAU_G00123670 [Synaphobranchus kaupii]